MCFCFVLFCFDACPVLISRAGYSIALCGLVMFKLSGGK